MLNVYYGDIYDFVRFLDISFGDNNLLEDILLILSVLRKN